MTTVSFFLALVTAFEFYILTRLHVLYQWTKFGTILSDGYTCIEIHKGKEWYHTENTSYKDDNTDTRSDTMTKKRQKYKMKYKV